MKTLVLLVLLFFSTVDVLGQHVLMYKDGRTVPCKSVHFHREYAALKHLTGEEVRIPISEIDGYFNKTWQIKFYVRPNLIKVFDELGDLFIRTKDYRLVEREVNGAVCLYRYADQPTVAQAQTPSIYFAAKGTDARPVWKNSSTVPLREEDQGALAKKQMKENLISMISEDEELKRKVEGEDFKFKLKNIRDIIRAYNVKMFQKPLSDPNRKTGTVGFYLNTKRGNKEIYKLIVNDSLTYAIPLKTQLMISLPVSVHSKVCISTPVGDYCDILSASSFMIDYYELTFKGSDDSFDIEPKTLEQVQKHISQVNQLSNR